MCYFCHTLGNNPDAPKHRGENCRDARNTHSKKVKQLHASAHPPVPPPVKPSGGDSVIRQGDPSFELLFGRRQSPPLPVANAGMPPFFFIQTECGRYVDSSLPQGLVIADHQSAGGQGQLFSMSADGIITDATTHRVLDCRDVKKGNSILLVNPSGSSTQRWKICPDGSICLRDAALCLDVRGGQMAALTPLIVWTPHGKTNQRFRIVSIFVLLKLTSVIVTCLMFDFRLPLQQAGLQSRLLKSCGHARGRDADLLCTRLSNLRATHHTAAFNANLMAATAVAVSMSLLPLLRTFPFPLWLHSCSARLLPLLQAANLSAKFACLIQQRTQQSHAAIACCVPTAIQAPSSQNAPFAELR